MYNTWKRIKTMAEEVCTIVSHITNIPLYEEILRSAPVGYHLAIAIDKGLVMAVSEKGYFMLESTLDYLHDTVRDITPIRNL